MSGDLKWNYLGCYVKKGPKPVVSELSTYGTKSQKSCLQNARNSKYFALQTGRGDNCFVGNEMSGTLVDPSQCTDVCTAGGDQLKKKDNQPGCGSAEAGPTKPFSVYGVTRSIMPNNIGMDRKNLLLDGSPSATNYKNGLYAFSDSSHAWHFSAKRIFDNKPNTFWMTPYTIRRPYSMRRSRNYTKVNYKQATGSSAIYNKEQKPYNRQLMDDPRNPFIVVGTKQAKLDPTDKTDAIVHYGEWCQIIYPFQMFLTEYTIHPAKLNPRQPVSEFARFPKHYVLLGSNDGIIWVALDSENKNKFTEEVAAVNITGDTMDNFMKGKSGNALGGAMKQVVVNKPYKIFRLVVKENHGANNVAIGQLILKGKICKNLGGDCTISAEPAGAEEFVNSSNMDEPETEGFEDINQSNNIDAIIEEESFTNMYNNETSQPLNELNVFQSDYSKFD